MSNLDNYGKQARSASYFLATASSGAKNKVLNAAADALIAHQDAILKANALDLEAAHNNGVKGALIDRLTLSGNRIADMAEGLRQVALLEDPIGEVLSMKRRPNGLTIGLRRVPFGVIGIIYEARPNVTVDAFGLCLKTGNATILRGGKEAIHANMSIIKVLQSALVSCGFPQDCVQLIEDTSRESSIALMKLNKYLDLLIPRGGAGLIRSVVENSTVPVIETGVGNCHIYIDESADAQMAVDIVFNAKTHRPGVCNAAESLLIHKSVAEKMLPAIGEKLQTKNVEIRGDETVCQILPYAVAATEEDWGTEYLDYIMSAKVVANVEEAIAHINSYGTRHSEAIVTENYANSQKFLDEVDAAAVYINASTRFTDGFEFGFGAEIGISTQKLHARGPMGLKELTSTKYIIYGNGQVRS